MCSPVLHTHTHTPPHAHTHTHYTLTHAHTHTHTLHRLVIEFDKVCKENQTRMSHDPFELMVMRLGVNMAASCQAPPTDHTHQADSDGNEEEEDGSGVRWIEDPRRCRQSWQTKTFNLWLWFVHWFYLLLRSTDFVVISIPIHFNLLWLIKPHEELCDCHKSVSLC